MPHSLEVILSPGEFDSLQRRDLTNSVCVVFDILRATTTMVTALAAGATAIVPVTHISEAIDYHRLHPEALLGGERDGLRIDARLTGGVEFHLGNSPREYTSQAVAGKEIVMTTTNGTRALRACAGARTVLVGSFLNLRATYLRLQRELPDHLILVCSGTVDQPALEDILAAGALCERIWQHYAGGQIADSAEIARRIYPLMQSSLLDAMRYSRNGRRLLSLPGLRDDVWLCVQRETVSFTAALTADGKVTRQFS